MSYNSVAADPAAGSGSPSGARGAAKKPLTHRERKRLRKIQSISRRAFSAGVVTAREDARRQRWFAAAMRAQNAAWQRVTVAPSDVLQAILDKVHARMVRRAERGHPEAIDLRRMDVRYWELRLVCRWNPNWRDKSYWPLRGAGRWGRTVSSELYAWWVGLDPFTRERLKEDSEAILQDTPGDIRPRATRRKRGNEKASLSSERTESPFAGLPRRGGGRDGGETNDDGDATEGRGSGGDGDAVAGAERIGALPAASPAGDFAGAASAAVRDADARGEDVPAGSAESAGGAA